MTKVRPEEEEYEFSSCAEDAIRRYWPDTLGPSHPLFQRFMIECQMELIRCHKYLMTPTDKRRALDTVRYLKEELRRIS